MGCDNDVVEKGDVEDLTPIADSPCYFAVGFGWLDIARWVVVAQYY